MLKKVLFDEFVRLNRGFDLPDSKIVFGKYPVVASTNIKGYHNEYKVEPPVVVTGRSGSLGKVQYISEKCWPLNTSLYSKDFRGNNPYYVYLFLQTMHLEQYNAGVGVPTLNQNHLHGLRIYIHNKPDQQKIVDILSKYDRLIETNNKRIKVLEQMAEELYKEWFVRFRFPGYETEEFENSIPKGWKIYNCSDLAYIKAGGDRPDVFSKTINEDLCVPIYSNGIDNEGLYGYTDKPIIKNDSVTISARGTVGFVCLRRTPYVPIVRLIAIVPDAKIVSSNYLYYYLKNDQVIGNGTSQQQITVPMVNKKKILVPSLCLLETFNEKEKIFFNKIDIIKKQNENLIKQRDLLLPRLMSGKLEV